MSKYTTEVRYICEYYAGKTESGDYSDIDNIISLSQGSIFTNYPIFNEAYRAALNAKILKHFYTREICEETTALWKLRLNNRMNEIMPYYNKLYNSELLAFNPFEDYSITAQQNRDYKGAQNENENIERQNDIKNTNNKNTNANRSNDEEQNINSSIISNENAANKNNENQNGIGTQNTKDERNTNQNNIGNTSSKDSYSDTPQGGLEGVESGKYLTNARIKDDNTNSNQNISDKNSQNTDSEYINKISGNSESEIAKSETKADKINSNKNENISQAENENKLINDILNQNLSNIKNKNESENNFNYEKGKRSFSSYSALLQEYRETFLNIDMLIINNLNDLFFGLWE